jgi:hypothetical protein
MTYEVTLIDLRGTREMRTIQAESARQAIIVLYPKQEDSIEDLDETRAWTGTRRYDGSWFDSASYPYIIAEEVPF